MSKRDLIEIRKKECINRICDLKQKLEDAKESAFAAHELFISSGKVDRGPYEKACFVRDRLKDELMNAESELNNIIRTVSESEFNRNENEFLSQGKHSKDLLNLAFICLGLVMAMLIKKLFF